MKHHGLFVSGPRSRGRRYAGLVGRVVGGCVLVVALGSCALGGKVFGTDDHKRVEKLLGTTLPPSAKDVKYYKYQPNITLTFYTAYIRFQASEAEYTELARRMGMEFYQDGENRYWYLLPGAWQLEPNLSLDWWNPSMDLPENTATRSFGARGWIIAKYESGNVFIKLRDPGE